MWKKALFLLSSVCGLAANADEYVVGVEKLDYLPYYSYQGDAYRGLSRELLDAFAAAQGHTFRYEILPVKRLYKNFLDGELDLKFPDNPYWQADMKKGHGIVYSDEVLAFVDGVMVQPQKQGKGLDALKTLGTVRGFTPWDYLERIEDKQIRLIENDNFAGLLQQVIRGRIDGAYINPVVANEQLEKVLKKPRALVFDPDLPHTRGAYLVSTTKHPALIKALNRFLAEKQDLIAELKKKYDVHLPPKKDDGEQ